MTGHTAGAKNQSRRVVAAVLVVRWKPRVQTLRNSVGRRLLGRHYVIPVTFGNVCAQSHRQRHELTKRQHPVHTRRHGRVAS